MSKRAAAVQLTADNYMEESEATEQAGEFEVASQDEIKQRVIKKAKRGWSSDQSSSSSSASSSSGGIFAKLRQSLTSSSEAAGLFSLTQPTATSSAATTLKFGSSALLTTAAPSSQFGSAPHVGLKITPSAPAPAAVASASGVPKKDATPTHTDEYLEQLSMLNNSVSQWISKHVTSNPYLDLTPIFKDYQMHLTSIDAKYKISPAPQTESSRDDSASISSVEDSNRNESDGNFNSEAADSTPSGDGSATSESPEATPASPPSNTSNKVQTTDNSNNTPATADNPAPSSDDSALHTVRAKLFYKKESEYVEVGVGTLKVLTSASSKGFVQLLMRNDTSLGNVMLNVKLSGDMPLSKSKKAVLVVCPRPNPPLSALGDAPVTYLLRVKTDESAEQLMEVIKHNTKE